MKNPITKTVEALKHDDGKDDIQLLYANGRILADFYSSVNDLGGPDAVSSVIGAATQIALLVAPVLVFASLLLPEPMDLLFNRLELVALIISVFTARNMTIDGKSDWLEGVMLIAVFVMLGIGFYCAA